MKNEYIIINKTAIQKRIEDLKKPIAHYDGIYVSDAQRVEYEVLEELLFQSPLLIPQIEKAFDAGKEYGFYEAHNANSGDIPDNDTYISNLKLDI